MLLVSWEELRVAQRNLSLGSLVRSRPTHTRVRIISIFRQASGAGLGGRRGNDGKPTSRPPPDPNCSVPLIAGRETRKA